jgi:2-keto-4-pentenoate hydratase/2-oxohepta-3-ene-1,7-dioic acid hydratase in catechol pathway
LNYRDVFPAFHHVNVKHAAEANMAIPTVPVLFVKPATAVADPYPGKIIIPKVAQDGTSDYEGELTVVIGKTGKDIKEEDAYDYILGYTSGNDVSARKAQFASSQWCYSKGNFARE